MIADCCSTEGLLRALEATTMQWGGSTNPLVPYFDVYPEALTEGLDRIDSFDKAYNVIARYHDPDRVLSVVDATLSFPIETVSLATVLKEDPDIVWDSVVGVGLLEVGRLFYHEQLRFRRRRDAIRVACIEAAAGLKISAAILYGALSPSTRDLFLEAMDDTIAPTPVSGIDFYEPFFQNAVTPRSVGQYNLSFSGCFAVGCIHEADPLDALTIWNAAVDHRHVIPLPLGAAFSTTLLERLTWHFKRVGANHVLVIRAASVTNEEMEQVFQAFRDAQIHVTFHDYLRVAPTKFESEASVHGTARRALRDLDERDESIDVEFLSPRLLGRDNLRYGDLRYVNEVSVTTHDRRRFPAEVLPPGLKRFWKRRFPSLVDFRIADTTLCLFAKRTDERESLPQPDATTIVRQFFEGRGFKTSVSPQGLAFQQLMILTDGATSSLNHPKVCKILQLFDASILDSDESGDPVNRVITWSEIQQAVSDRPDLSLRTVLDARLLEAGIILRCDNCGGRELYKSDEIVADTKCKRCQLSFIPPFHSPRAMGTWAYRLLPPFDNGKVRRGLLGMALALPVIGGSPGDKTIAAGIQLQKDEEPDFKIEIDLVALQRPSHDRPEIVPLFLEAKYSNAFSELDVARMAFLRRIFPYAVFGFSTIRPVSAIEPHVLRRLRAFSRIRNSRGETTHTTMLLTERELRPSFETIQEGDHIVGYLSEIGRETMKRYLSSTTTSYVKWRAEREAAFDLREAERASRLAKKARAVKAETAPSTPSPVNE